MKYLIQIIIIIFTTTIVNSQTRQTYSGNFSGNSTTGTATYTYYEGNNYQRIYDGNFSYSTITATNVKINIKGNFKDSLRNGTWTTNVNLLRPLGNTIGLTEKSTLNYKNGKLHGKASDYIEKKERWSGGVAVTTTYISANFNNGLFYDKISTLFKNDGIMTISINGNFDENGYMHGEWIIQYHERRNSFDDIKNSPIIKDVREYQHGVLSKNTIIKTSTGEILDQYDNSKIVNNFFKFYQKKENISTFENKTYEISDIVDGSHVGFGYGNEHLTDLFSWWLTQNNDNNLMFEISIGAKPPRMIVERTITEIDIISLAVDYARKGDFENAIKYTDIAVNIDKTNIENNNLLGMYLIFNKQFEEAEIQLEKTYSLCRGNCDLLLQVERNLSHAYLLNNHYNKAFEIHKRNINKKIEDEKWLDVIYKDFDRLKFNNIESPNFDKLKIDMQNFEYSEFIKKADGYFDNEKYSDAKENYNKALEIKPNETYPQNKIIEINKIEKAIAEYPNVCKLINKKVVEVEKAYKSSTATNEDYILKVYERLYQKQNFPNELYNLQMIEQYNNNNVTSVFKRGSKKLYKKYLIARDYLQKETKNSNSVIEKYLNAETLLNLLNRMLALQKQNTKDMQKTLKKVDEPNEILNIIGIERL